MPHQLWIKATLKKKGCKLKDMASALGIPAPRVTDILQGTREVQSDELEALAELLGLSLNSLLASLAAGELTHAADTEGKLPVLGLLMGNGKVQPFAGDNNLKHVALPPDAETTAGLSCYIMGDNSMAQEIKAGDIIIAADPRQHFYPMVPGGLFLVQCSKEQVALRQLVKADGGEYWLVPLPEQPDPKLSSWRFSMLGPDLMAETTGDRDTKDGDTEIPSGETVHTPHIIAAVLWVHRRYRANAPG